MNYTVTTLYTDIQDQKILRAYMDPTNFVQKPIVIGKVATGIHLNLSQHNYHLTIVVFIHNIFYLILLNAKELSLYSKSLA